MPSFSVGVAMVHFNTITTHDGHEWTGLSLDMDFPSKLLLVVQVRESITFHHMTTDYFSFTNGILVRIRLFFLQILRPRHFWSWTLLGIVPSSVAPFHLPGASKTLSGLVNSERRVPQWAGWCDILKFNCNPVQDCRACSQFKMSAWPGRRAQD